MVIDLRVLTVQWERDALNQRVIIGFPKLQSCVRLRGQRRTFLMAFAFLKKLPQS